MKRLQYLKIGIYSGEYDVRSTGWFQTLTSLRVPVATVTAAELESSDLKGYPLIILPGGQKVTLSSMATVRVKQYAESGGSLLGVCAGMH